MHTVPKSWVYAAAALLGVAAIGSVVLGATRGNPHDIAAETSPLAPVPNASDAKAIVDPTADDAHIRQLAREEAQALLRSAAPKPKPVAKPADDAGEDSASDTSPPTSASSSSSARDPTTVRPSSLSAGSASAASVAGQRALLGSSRSSSTSAPD